MFLIAIFIVLLRSNGYFRVHIGIYGHIGEPTVSVKVPEYFRYHTAESLCVSAFYYQSVSVFFVDARNSRGQRA